MKSLLNLIDIFHIGILLFIIFGPLLSKRYLPYYIIAMFLILVQFIYLILLNGNYVQLPSHILLDYYLIQTDSTQLEPYQCDCNNYQLLHY